jgi:chemotaxis response regulator CheB
LLAESLAAEPTIEVVGVVANGSVALDRIAQVNPDLVTLDVALPEMDGLQPLSAIRKSYPRLPVIMLSTLTERAATVALEALALGATDYATKPLFFGSANGSIARMRNEIVPKIKALCGRWACENSSSAPFAGCAPATTDKESLGCPSGVPDPSCGGYCRDWRVHWRPRRARRAHAAFSRRLPRAHRNRATQAADLYPPACRSFDGTIAHQGKGGG